METLGVGPGKMYFWDILEHDQDTPSDRPLLTADQPATLGRRSQFRDVDRHLGRANAHA